MDDSLSSPPLPSAVRWQRLGWLTLFTAINACVAIAIVLGNTPLQDNPGGALGVGYLGIALPGHFLFFGALVSLLPLAVGLWPRSARPLYVSAMILQGLWLCLLLVDAKVFELYRFHLNAMVLNMVFGGALQDQVALSWQTWLQVGGVLLAVAAAGALLGWACWQLLPPSLDCCTQSRRPGRPGWRFA